MAQSAVSQQLRVLRSLDFVVGRRSGRQTIYELHDPHVAVLLDEAPRHIEHLRGGLESDAGPGSRLRSDDRGEQRTMTRSSPL